MSTSEDRDKAQLLRLISERIESITLSLEGSSDNLFSVSVDDLNGSLASLERIDDLLCDETV